MGQEDRFAGAEDLSRLGHEMHPTENDQIGIGFRGLDRQSQRISGEIG